MVCFGEINNIGEESAIKSQFLSIFLCYQMATDVVYIVHFHIRKRCDQKLYFARKYYRVIFIFDRGWNDKSVL